MAEVPTGLALPKIARCLPARLCIGIRAAPVIALKEFPPVKAVRYHGRKDIRIEDVKEPDGYGPNQLLVKPLWTGICGTDLHEYIAGPIVTPATPHVFTAAILPQIIRACGGMGTRIQSCTWIA